MNEDAFGLIFAAIMWVWGTYLISKYTYLVWFDYPNAWNRMQAPFYFRKEPDWFRSAPAELFYKLILPLFWFIWVILVPFTIIYSEVTTP